MESWFLINYEVPHHVRPALALSGLRLGILKLCFCSLLFAQVLLTSEQQTPPNQIAKLADFGGSMSWKLYGLYARCWPGPLLTP